MSHSDIEVRLAAYNLTALGEEDVVLRNVSEIFVHPEWMVYDHVAKANLAILVLNDKVPFTKYIQHISLPADDVLVDSTNINLRGITVGWVLAENNTLGEIPIQADIKAINDSQCFRMNRHIVNLSSERTFCVGSEEWNPTMSECGGGLFVRNFSNWVQYGVTSAVVLYPNGSIDRSSPIVFTNVQSFHSWIRDTVQNK